MNTKKNVLHVSIGYVIYFFTLLLIGTVCDRVWCDIQEDGFLVSILYFFAPLLPIFFFSLITYKMKDEVFRAWWRFARWWVLVIIAATLLLQNASGGGTLGMNKDFTVFILIILYSILIVTSLVKIVRAYLRTKNS